MIHKQRSRSPKKKLEEQEEQTEQLYTGKRKLETKV
jgi:hypothetical protein